MAKRALALDLGTSSVRAIVFETEGLGTVAAVEGALARRPRHLSSDQPGQATFNVEDYFADLVACIDELSAKGALDGVEAVGTDSQWHSILPVNHAGQPLGDLVSWADTRPPRPPGAPSPGTPALEELRQRTGCAFAAMYWTWRAPWLTAAGGTTGPRANGGTHFMGLTEYVDLHLLDDPSISVSMASGTGLLATATNTWDDEALELAGLRPSSLPPLAPPDWHGRLSQEWRRRWPALSQAVWHPALGDGAAANLGVGCNGPGRAALTVGTSAAVRSVRAAPDFSRLPAGLWRYCVDHRRVVVGAAYSSGGQLYAWALALSEGTDGSASAEVRYDQPMPVDAGSDGVVVLPWHAGTRPPAPRVAAGQGCVLDLGLGHTGSHIVSAAVEAVCFQLAGGLADVESIGGGTLEIVANGGAIDRSEWWRRRLVSTLARPVRFPTAPETTARGTAAMALGIELGHEEEEELLTPDPDDVAKLALARRRWATWYEQLLPITSVTRA
jgi:gluconokinase